MKIKCDKEKLSNAVSNVSRAVSSKSSIPALEGILMKAENDQLFLTGYDLELGITTTIPARTEEQGAIVLSARLFSDMVRRIDAEYITIETDDKLLTVIRGGKAEFTILGIPAEEFPEIPTIRDESNIELSQPVLKSMIEQTLFAVSVSDAKPVHTGSLFDLSGGELKMVSVDGFRLALRREKIASQESLSFIVPGKTLSEIGKLLQDSDEMVSLSIGRKHIIFEIAGYLVISRLIEGEFLDYAAAIPAGAATTVKTSVRVLSQGIERASLLITDRLKSPLKCEFDAAEGVVSLSCTTSIGKAYDEVPCEITGDDVEIGFNNRYLLDALKASSCDEVKLEMNGSLSPMKVVPLEGDSFLFLVLPVRLKNE